MAQDPYIRGNKICGIPSEWLVFSSNTSNSIIIFTNLDYTVVSSLVNNNSVFVNLSLDDNRTLVIGSQYSPPSSDIDDDFEEWVNFIPETDNVLIGADLNVHLKALGYARENKRTETFLEHLIVKNLFLLNDPQADHTWTKEDMKGRPDVTLGGTDICNDLLYWKVDSDVHSFSDHKYIRFCLNYSAIRRNTLRFKTKNKSFFQFNKLLRSELGFLESELTRVNDCDSMDSWMNKFYEVLERLLNRCFRRGTISHKPSLKWYTETLRIERNKVNAAYKRSRRYPDNMVYKNSYHVLRNNYKKNIKITRKKSWLTFCEKTSDAFGTVYKYIAGKYLQHTDMIFTILENSHIFDTYDDVVKNLMEEHFGILHPPEVIYEYTPDIDMVMHEEHPLFTHREMRYAVFQQDVSKAPGYDDIDGLVVRNLSLKFPSVMLKMYNTCYSLGYFPKIWKKGKIIFFRKRNKDPKLLRAYRPITLLPIMGKVYERMIKMRVMTALESQAFLNDSQHGFREMRSTITAVMALRKYVKAILQNFKYCTAVSLDIEGAFDSMCWSTLSDIIDEAPLTESLKSSLKSYISHRQIGCLLSTGLNWSTIYKGCPQGSCLGPLLWNLVADKLLKIYTEIYENIVSYADDFLIIVGASTRASLESCVNDRIACFERGCNTLRLKLSPSKSEAIMFGRYNLENRRPIFKLAGISVPVRDTLMYLGFMLDSRFSWQLHLDYVREKISSFLINIKRTGRRDRGLSAFFLKTWYKVVVSKQITYGFEVWFPDLRVHALRKLSSCQRLGLMSIIQPYRTVSTDALCVLCGIPPMHIQLKYLARKFAVLHADSYFDTEDNRIWHRDVMEGIPTYRLPNYFALANLRIIPTKKNVVIHNEKLMIFTDGSKMNEGVSAAFTVHYGDSFIFDYKIRLQPGNSVYQAELLAIQYAVKWFVNTEFMETWIYTDSESSVGALQHLFPSNIIILNIYQTLIDNPNKKVNLSWIKAHVGEIGNERADGLAKEAITDNTFDCIDNLALPRSIMNDSCFKLTLRDWQKEWQDSEKGRDTYSIIDKVSFDFLSESKIITYFLSGHGSFPTFLFKIKKRSDNLCICGNIGSPMHYLFTKCSIMPYTFKFDRSKTMKWNARNVLFRRENYVNLCRIYNKLNETFSFIKYKF